MTDATQERSVSLSSSDLQEIKLALVDQVEYLSGVLQAGFDRYDTVAEKEFWSSFYTRRLEASNAALQKVRG